MALGKRTWRCRKRAWRGAIVKVARGKFLESFCSFTKSDYCVSLPMKHNLEMFFEIREHDSDMVKMHKIT